MRFTRTGMPASARVRMLRSRRAGAAARGSSVREMAGSSVVSVMAAMGLVAGGHGGDQVDVALD